MIKNGCISVLPEGEIERRYCELLRLGISERAIGKLIRVVENLCDHDIAKRRIENLRTIGYVNPLEMIEAQPFLLMRSEVKVAASIDQWGFWCKIIDSSVSIYELSQKRAQIFSAKIEKVHLVFLLSQFVKKNVTISCICNIVTLNIESVLIGFVRYAGSDLNKIRRAAQHHQLVPQNASWQERALMIRNIRHNLPNSVYVAYIQLVITSHPHKDSTTIIDVLQN